MFEIIEGDQIQSIRSHPERTHKKITLDRRTSTQVIFSSGVTILMRCCGSIALHQMKLQTWEAHHSKAYDHIYILRARQLIPIERSRAVIDQRSPAHTFVWMRRWANTVLTGITLRQYRSLLYELLMAQGNIFQHCASARESGVQIGDLECGEAI